MSYDPNQPVWEIFVMMILLLIGVIYSIVYSKSKQDLILDYWICISRNRRKERMLQKLVDVAHFAVSVLGTSAPPTHV